MSNAHADWPATAWQLSAPESAVLLNGSGVPGRDTFKLALMELLTRGALRLVEVEERGMLGRTRRTKVLTDGARPTAPRETVLARVWDLYHARPAASFADGTRGVKLPDFLQAARQRAGGVPRFTANVVVPSLLERGLLERQEKRLLLVFKETRFEPTAEGRAARAELERWMSVATEQFEGWTRTDPSRALAFSAMAGAALLLMPALLPNLQELNQQLMALQPGGVSTADAGDIDVASEELDGGLDLSGLDLSALAFDFGALDDLDSAFDAIDSAVDAGDGGSDGGDGGSDGGGDGGGD